MKTLSITIDGAEHEYVEAKERLYCTVCSMQNVCNEFSMQGACRCFDRLLGIKGRFQLKETTNN